MKAREGEVLVRTLEVGVCGTDREISEGLFGVAPEAARGGPLAVLQDGDVIAIDVDEGTLVVELDDGELAERLVGWEPPPPRYDVGVFARYRALVSSASDGAVLTPPA